MQLFPCAPFEKPPPSPGFDRPAVSASAHADAPPPPNKAHMIVLEDGDADGPAETSKDQFSSALENASSRGWKMFLKNPAGVLVGSMAALSVAALLLWGVCCYSQEIRLRDRIPSNLLEGALPNQSEVDDRKRRGHGKRGKKSRQSRKEKIHRDDEEEGMLPVHEVELGDEGDGESYIHSGYPSDDDDRLRRGPQGGGRRSRGSSVVSEYRVALD